MGGRSSKMNYCLDALCAGRGQCYQKLKAGVYNDTTWAVSRNLDIAGGQLMMYRPDTAEEVAQAVKCAVKHQATVQALSGAHSYGNHAVTTNFSLVIDLSYFKKFQFDQEKGVAYLSAGMFLDQIDQHLWDYGGWAIPHGSCPSIGIGGHATLGGIGPISRLWGTLLDNVIEVEVVVSPGEIRRANESYNADLFWAVRGAGPDFGIVTEFVVQARDAPIDVLHFTYSIDVGDTEDNVDLFDEHRNSHDVFDEWIKVATDPKLDRRFSTQFVAHQGGAWVRGTFYGTEEEFRATKIHERLSLAATWTKGSSKPHLLNWQDSLKRQAEETGRVLSNIQVAFDSKSLMFTRKNLPSAKDRHELFEFLKHPNWDPLTWFVVFEGLGGAISDALVNATAFPHRDAVLMYQAYALAPTHETLTDRAHLFLDGVQEILQQQGASGAYAGYVMPGLDRAVAQQMYWGPNLDWLKEVKKRWDPMDVFRNPQSLGPKIREVVNWPEAHVKSPRADEEQECWHYRGGSLRETPWVCRSQRPFLPNHG